MKTLLNYFLNKQWILNIIMLFLNEGKKEKIYIQRIRAEFLFWGHDISSLTDEEIKEGLKNIANEMGSFGMTTKEASNALSLNPPILKEPRSKYPC